LAFTGRGARRSSLGTEQNGAAGEEGGVDRSTDRPILGGRHFRARTKRSTE